LCPFRRWALHRLGLQRLQEHHGFPDARDRGVVTHEVLYRALHRDALPPAHPADLEGGQLDLVLSRVLTERYRRFPAALREAERRRLGEVVKRWLEAEGERAPFAVEALEHEVELTLAGLTLHLRFDRVDQVDGARVVLDYKTGRAEPQRLLEERLTEPQLPLYALADAAIRGVVFVEVGDGEVVCKGAAAADVDLSPVRLVPLTEDWDAMRERWRVRLEALATEILRGRADVAPVGPEACRICHLQPFCRIHEHPEALADGLEPPGNDES
jgi:ATP-dependent helicase/nuclease subunit B